MDINKINRSRILRYVYENEKISKLDIAYALGFEITKSHIQIVLIDLAGALLRNDRILQTFSAKESYFARLEEIVENFLRDHDAPRDKILGLGISIPGIVSESGDRIVDPHVLGQRHFDCEALTSRIPYPCVVANDADAACEAEIRGRALSPIS